MQIKKNIRVSLLLLSIGILEGCSSTVDQRYIGIYDGIGGHIEIVNRDGEFFGKTGMCLVSLDPIDGHSQVILDSRCKVDGNTITMTFDRPDEKHFYPEFRGTTAILTLDKDTLITQTGKRFAKRGSVTSGP